MNFNGSSSSKKVRRQEEVERLFRDEQRMLALFQPQVFSRLKEGSQSQNMEGLLVSLLTFM